ncbi:hypothetical protein GCM10010515_74740 [Streptomyces fructofermentans]|uniref:Uncharacterized protein n=1 Tax=Streptomyces fructofermentans TaxID=152141 RepID=A0A918NUV2_9ACTN|nr:hypothetical protein GCM10010515_74740 [Streptomyces fructofermentans]
MLPASCAGDKCHMAPRLVSLCQYQLTRSSWRGGRSAGVRWWCGVRRCGVLCRGGEDAEDAVAPWGGPAGGGVPDAPVRRVPGPRAAARPSGVRPVRRGRAGDAAAFRAATRGRLTAHRWGGVE